MTPLLNGVHLATCAYMTGVIWFVQLVQYPMLHLASGDQQEAGHREYTRRMTAVVMPVMLMEFLLQGLWLTRDGSAQAWTGSGLLLAVWLSTFFLQVPCHRKLSQKFEPAVQKRLVLSNWIRTAGWSLRTILLVSVLTA